ncbi:MAG: RsiV family protein [Oscillospiraceae bacterium]|jgi:hypothetical protein|nr:RsiV family protein [Oscillospiraceae bacterium]
MKNFNPISAALVLCLLASCGLSPSPSASPSVSLTPSDTLTDSGGPSEPQPSPSHDWNDKESAPPYQPPESFPPSESLPPNSVNIGNTVWSQTYKDGAVECLVASAGLPLLSGAPDAINDFYSGVLDSFQTKCENRFAQAKADYQSGVLAAPYEMSLNYYTELNSGGYFSVYRVETLDSGGARPIFSISCDTFSLSGGARLTLDDFFNVSAAFYLPLLLSHVRDYIARDPESYYAEDAEAYFPYETFCLTPGGISLFYPPDSIAAFAVGAVRIDIPHSALGDIWNWP